MRIFFLLLLVLTSGCSDLTGSKNPRRYFIQEMTVPASQKTEIEESIRLLNEGGGDVINYSQGDRPLIIRSASLPGATLSKATPRTYGCLIEISQTNSVLTTDPAILRYIFAHELGHCYGLAYSNDPDDIMYFSLITSWSSALESKVKALGARLKALQ